MDSKLQQAIIATRAGYDKAAQVLLTDALQENPEETDAWFLLAHLVEEPERQARYLEYTLTLDPEYKMARDHLERLLKPDVPPPVIKLRSNHSSTSTLTTPPPAVDSLSSPIPAPRTNPALAISSRSETPASASPSIGNEQVAAEQKSSRIDADWQKTAGSPKRASQASAAAPVQQEAKPTTAVVTETAVENKKKQPVNKWLLAIFIILIAVAAFVISYLVFSIIIQ